MCAAMTRPPRGLVSLVLLAYCLLFAQSVNVPTDLDIWQTDQLPGVKIAENAPWAFQVTTRGHHSVLNELGKPVLVDGLYIGGAQDREDAFVHINDPNLQIIFKPFPVASWELQYDGTAQFNVFSSLAYPPPNGWVSVGDGRSSGFEVTSPTEGDIYDGRSHEILFISWNTCNTNFYPQHVKLELYLDTTLQRVIVASMENTGSYTWDLEAPVTTGDEGGDPVSTLHPYCLADSASDFDEDSLPAVANCTKRFQDDWCSEETRTGAISDLSKCLQEEVGWKQQSRLLPLGQRYRVRISSVEQPGVAAFSGYFAVRPQSPRTSALKLDVFPYLQELEAGVFPMGNGDGKKLFQGPFTGDGMAVQFQSLYLASELTAAGLQKGDKLNSLSFKLKIAPNFLINSFSIGLAWAQSKESAFVVRNNEFSWQFTTTVYGPLSLDPGSLVSEAWNSFPFAKNFTMWDGVSHLIIDVTHNQPSVRDNTGHMFFQYPRSGTRSLSINSGQVPIPSSDYPYWNWETWATKTVSYSEVMMVRLGRTGASRSHCDTFFLGVESVPTVLRVSGPSTSRPMYGYYVATAHSSTQAEYNEALVYEHVTDSTLKVAWIPEDSGTWGLYYNNYAQMILTAASSMYPQPSSAVNEWKAAKNATFFRDLLHPLPKIFPVSSIIRGLTSKASEGSTQTPRLGRTYNLTFSVLMGTSLLQPSLVFSYTGKNEEQELPIHFPVLNIIPQPAKQGRASRHFLSIRLDPAVFPASVLLSRQFAFKLSSVQSFPFMAFVGRPLSDDINAVTKVVTLPSVSPYFFIYDQPTFFSIAPIGRFIPIAKAVSVTVLTRYFGFGHTVRVELMYVNKDKVMSMVLQLEAALALPDDVSTVFQLPLPADKSLYPSVLDVFHDREDPTVEYDSYALRFTSNTFKTSALSSSFHLVHPSDIRLANPPFEVMADAPLVPMRKGSGSPFNTWFKASRMQSLYLPSDLLLAGLSAGSAIYGFDFHIHDAVPADTVRMVTNIFVGFAWVPGEMEALESFEKTTLFHTKVAVDTKTLTADSWIKFEVYVQGNELVWDGLSGLVLDLGTIVDMWDERGRGGLYARGKSTAHRTRSLSMAGDDYRTWPFINKGHKLTELSSAMAVRFETQVCGTNNKCNSHGECVEGVKSSDNNSAHGSCKCHPDYFGVTCHVFCSPIDSCMGNGHCDFMGQCVCGQGFSGEHCQFLGAVVLQGYAAATKFYYTDQQAKVNTVFPGSPILFDPLQMPHNKVLQPQYTYQGLYTSELLREAGLEPGILIRYIMVGVESMPTTGVVNFHVSFAKINFKQMDFMVKQEDFIRIFPTEAEWPLSNFSWPLTPLNWEAPPFFVLKSDDQRIYKSFTGGQDTFEAKLWLRIDLSADRWFTFTDTTNFVVQVAAGGRGLEGLDATNAAPGSLSWVRLNNDDLAYGYDFANAGYDPLGTATPYLLRLQVGSCVGDPPIIFKVEPSRGSTRGRTLLTLTGENLGRSASDLIDVFLDNGNIKCNRVHWLSSTSVTCITPSVKKTQNLKGEVLVVTRSSGGNEDSKPVYIPDGEVHEERFFTYVRTPEIIDVTPNHGPSVGGTAVDVIGKFLGDSEDEVQTVFVGLSLCRDVKWKSSNLLSCVTGPSSSIISEDATVMVTVNTKYGGPSEGAGKFVYNPVLTVQVHAVNGDDAKCTQDISSPCKSIAAALAAYPKNGLTIMVGPGVYYEKNLFLPAFDISLVSLEGPARTFIIAKPCDPRIEVECHKETSVRVMDCVNNNHWPLQITGFTMTSMGVSNRRDCGGVIRLAKLRSMPVNGVNMPERVEKPVTFTNVWFVNSSSSEGSALCIQDVGTVFLTDVLFANNGNVNDSNSGALLARDTTVHILNSRFLNNVGAVGGAITAMSVKVVIRDSQFENNLARNHGGAISCTQCPSLDASTTTFARNRAQYSGGSVSLSHGTTISFVECDFLENTLGSMAMNVEKIDSNAFLQMFQVSAEQFMGGGAIDVEVSDISITSCKFIGNAVTEAGTGGAIHSVFSTLAVQDSQFIGNEAIGGGGCALESRSTAQFFNVLFFNNTAHNILDEQSNALHARENTAYGGALSVSLSQSVGVYNSLFMKNKAAMGGGVFITKSSNIFFQNSTFDSNLADLGGGAIVGYQAVITFSPHVVVPSRFVNNAVVSGGGGALLLDASDIADLDLTNVKFDNNNSSYSRDVGSEVESIAVYQNGKEITYISVHSSGAEFVPPLQVQLRDVLGHIISSDSSSLVRIASQSLIGGAQFKGGVQQVAAGTAVFEGFAVEAPPGRPYNITFEVLDRNAQPILSLPVAINMNPCQDGEFNTGRLCVRCSADSYITFPMALCEPCAVGSKQSAQGTGCECTDPLLRGQAPPCVRNARLEGGNKMALMAISCVLAVLYMVIFCCIVKYRHNRVIHSASPLFCCIMCAGGMVAAGSALLGTMDIRSSFQCLAKLWMFHIGFSLSFGSLFVKTLRLHRIFNNPHARGLSIKNNVLVTQLMVLLGIDLVLLLCISFLKLYGMPADGGARCVTDTSGIAGYVMFGLLIAFKGGLLLVGPWLTYKVRSVPSIFNESRYVAICVYNTMISAAAWIVITYLIGDQVTEQTLVMLDTLIIQMLSITVMILIFVPKFYAIYTKADEKLSRAHKKIDDRTMSQIKTKSIIKTNSIKIETSGTPVPTADELATATKTMVATEDRITKLQGAIRRLEIQLDEKQKEIKDEYDALADICSNLDFMQALAKSGEKSNLERRGAEKKRGSLKKQVLQEGSKKILKLQLREPLLEPGSDRRPKKGEKMSLESNHVGRKQSSRRDSGDPENIQMVDMTGNNSDPWCENPASSVNASSFSYVSESTGSENPAFITRVINFEDHEDLENPASE